MGDINEMVGVIGLEPTRVTPPDPRSGASANFATPPYKIGDSREIRTPVLAMKRRCPSPLDDGVRT